MTDLLTLRRSTLVPILLVDGPCAGTWTQVAAWGQECWQRVGRTGVDKQVWARYDHSPLRQGEYFYSGMCLSTSDLGAALAAHKKAGHTHGESRGL
jgi:hypothetical protein